MLRFAPSPTGDMHIGSLRVAIFNYILAKQQNKEFIVRIEDSDVEKNIEGKDGEILAILQKFGLNDDNLYYQSKNKHIHQHMALKLVEQKKAFACFCSDEEINAQKNLAKNQKKAYRYSGKCEFLTQKEILKSDKKYVVRLKKPQKDIVFNDTIKGEITATPQEVDSFVILQSDGNPTHNFASAIDDMVQGISYICHTQKHICDTPKQIHIRNMLDYEKTILYAHLPAFLQDDDVSSVKWLLSEGFLPNAIINYLILLGNKTPNEVFDLHEAIKWFDIKSLSKTASKFEIEKLQFLNRAHIKKTEDRELSKYFGFSEREIGKLAKLFTHEASTLKEIDAKIAAIFKPKNFNNEYKQQMQILQQIILKAPVLSDFYKFEQHIMEKSKLKGENLSIPLRLLLTGLKNGPLLSEIYPFIKGYLTQIVR